MTINPTFDIDNIEELFIFCPDAMYTMGDNKKKKLRPFIKDPRPFVVLCIHFSGTLSVCSTGLILLIEQGCFNIIHASLAVQAVLMLKTRRSLVVTSKGECY